MELGEALFRAVSGGRSSNRRPDPAGDLREAQQRAGGVSQLARALGVDRTTVQRWNRAGRPSAAGEALISAALRIARVPESRVDRLSRSTSLRVEGDQEGRGQRQITIGPGDLSPGMWRAVVDAYLTGATPADLAKIAGQHIRDPFYRKLLTGMGRTVPGSSYRLEIGRLAAR